LNGFAEKGKPKNDQKRQRSPKTRLEACSSVGRVAAGKATGFDKSLGVTAMSRSVSRPDAKSRTIHRVCAEENAA
jgi:hypothetical protein